MRSPALCIFFSHEKIEVTGPEIVQHAANLSLTSLREINFASFNVGVVVRMRMEFIGEKVVEIGADYFRLHSKDK